MCDRRGQKFPISKIRMSGVEVFQRKIERGIDDDRPGKAMRELAPELPLPFVDNEGNAIVPPVSLALLDEFESDEEVCIGFVGGSFRGDSWMGNGGDHFRAKAASARRFLSHSNRCIRRWAEQEIARSESLAATEQIRDEERFIE
jgi:hypothetical protein